MTLDHTKPYDTLSEAELLEYDQLLAEIAGYAENIERESGGDMMLFNEKWQPRQNRDQMAMVLENVPQKLKYKTAHQIWVHSDCSDLVDSDGYSGYCIVWAECFDFLLTKPETIAAALYPIAGQVAGIVEGERLG